MRFVCARRGLLWMGLLAAVALLASAGADTPTGEGRKPKNESGRGEVPEDWLEGTASTRAKRFAELKAGATPPRLQVSDWKNAEPMELEALKGKVVMLDFWATWCGPCIASIPHGNELYEQYKADGLVIIGVCHERGAEKMAETVESKGIKYPVAADTKGETVAAYAVDSFPDYYFIDRSGKLRILDCKNARVDDAIKLLLAEKPE